MREGVEPKRKQTHDDGIREDQANDGSTIDTLTDLLARTSSDSESLRAHDDAFAHPE